MHIVRFGLLLAGLTLGTTPLTAQQPAPHPTAPRPHAGMMMDSSAMAAHAQMSDSLDDRLDTLVKRMNGATGERKVAAMADVLNELVAQRKVMRARMHRMMDPGVGMRHHPNGMRPTPSDSAGPAEHPPS